MGHSHQSSGCPSRTTKTRVWRTPMFPSDSFAFREPRRQKTTTGTRMATSIRTAPIREHDLQHRELQNVLIFWTHTANPPKAQNARHPGISRAVIKVRFSSKCDHRNSVRVPAGESREASGLGTLFGFKICRSSTVVLRNQRSLLHFDTQVSSSLAEWNSYCQGKGGNKTLTSQATKTKESSSFYRCLPPPLPRPSSGSRAVSPSPLVKSSKTQESK